MKKSFLFFGLLGLLVFTACKKDRALSSLGANGKSVGASANDLLSSSKFKTLTIEIQYVEGFQPQATTVTNIKSYLETLVNKPSGVNIIQKAIPSPGKSVLSIDDVSNLEKNNRTVFNDGDNIGVYLLFTDGSFSTANVLGVAFRNTSMCIFGKTVADNSGGIGQPSAVKLESTVSQHEFGHILGLVDIGSAMQTNHKDNANGSHCNNENCLMYFSVETTDFIANLITGNIPTLDANCRADLKANGGK